MPPSSRIPHQRTRLATTSAPRLSGQSRRRGGRPRWDEPRDASLTGYEIGWRIQGEDEWRQRIIGRGDRSQVDGLANGDRYAFRIRALAADQASPWIEAPGVEIGPVDRVSAFSAVGHAPVGLLLPTLWYGLIHAATTP